MLSSFEPTSTTPPPLALCLGQSESAVSVIILSSHSEESLYRHTSDDPIMREVTLVLSELPNRRVGGDLMFRVLIILFRGFGKNFRGRSHMLLRP